MKIQKLNLILPAILCLAFLSSCSVVTGIFKAGMGFGIFLVVLVVVVIIFLVSRANKK